MIFLSLATCIGLAFPQADTLMASAHLQKAEQFIAGKNYDSAQYFANLAHTMYQQASHQKGMGKALLQSGTASYFLRKSKQALVALEQALQVLKPVATEQELYDLGIYNKVGVLNLDLGHYDAALKHFEAAYRLCTLFGSESNLSTALVHYNLGATLSYFGDYQSALAHYLKALPTYIQEYGRGGNRVAHIYNNIGITHNRLGDYEYASDFFRKAISIHLQNDGPLNWNLAIPYQGLASAFAHTGARDSAHYYYERILHLCSLHKAEYPRMVREEANAYAGLAIMYKKEADYQRCQKYAHLAIEILKELYHDLHPDLNAPYFTLAEACKDQGDYENALLWANRISQNVLHEFGNYHPYLAQARRLEAEVYLKQLEFDKALSKVDEAIQSLSTSGKDRAVSSVQEVSNPKIYLSLLAEKAVIFSTRAKTSATRKEDLVLALEHYIEAVLVIDHIRRGYLSEDSKLFLQDNSIGIYEQALSVCSDLHKITGQEDYLEHAFIFMEKSKASILSEAIQSYNLKAIQGIPIIVLQKEEELFRKLKSTELALAHASKGVSGRIDSLADVAIGLRVSIDSLSNSLQKFYPHYYNLKYNTDVASLKSLRQKQQGKGTVILIYFEGEAAWYVCSVSYGNIALDVISKEKISTDLVRTYNSMVRDGRSNVDELTEMSGQIFDALVRLPLQNHDAFVSLVIVPDGSLGYLPFEALVTNASKDNAGRMRYLIEDSPVSYAASLTLYLMSHSQNSSYPSNYLGFAPSYSDSIIHQLPDRFKTSFGELPGAVHEVQAAGMLYSGRTFLMGDATENNFKRHTDPARIIHLAMHALVDDTDPMNSMFLFARDSIEDGYLHAYELYNLQLKSQLAILGACNTGAGKIMRGEGVLSLSRAFMYAGCPNVVLNLWNAKDAPTSMITRDFLANLRSGLGKEDALRMAKVKYLSSTDPLQAHPANWASLVMIGNAEPIHMSSYPLLYTVLLIALILSALTYVWWRVSRTRQAAIKMKHR
jgi:CHAT domain-containing protein/tetratricopeptide (TPR) repeat protein